MRLATWAGAAAGASLVYFLDHDRGRERRQRASRNLLGVARLIGENRRPRATARIQTRSRPRLAGRSRLFGRGPVAATHTWQWPVATVTIDIDQVAADEMTTADLDLRSPIEDLGVATAAFPAEMETASRDPNTGSEARQ